MLNLYLRYKYLRLKYKYKTSSSTAHTHVLQSQLTSKCSALSLSHFIIISKS